MQNIHESEKIYHRCFNKNRDGTNKLIRKGEKCLIPTNKPFWRYSEDVPDGIKTRAQEKRNKKILHLNSTSIILNKKTFRDG